MYIETSTIDGNVLIGGHVTSVKTQARVPATGYWICNASSTIDTHGRVLCVLLRILGHHPYTAAQEERQACRVTCLGSLQDQPQNQDYHARHNQQSVLQRGRLP